MALTRSSIFLYHDKMAQQRNAKMEMLDWTGGGDIYSIYSPSYPPMSKEFSIFPTINNKSTTLGKR